MKEITKRPVGRPKKPQEMRKITIGISIDWLLADRIFQISKEASVPVSILINKALLDFYPE